MEENKAAAYYDELVRKGVGAARFKQGLGYDAQSSDTGAANNVYLASHMFVKGASRDDNLSAIEKDIRLANVRDKLKKHDVSGSNKKSSFQKNTTIDISIEHNVQQGMEDRDFPRLSKKSNTTSPERGSEYSSRGSHLRSSGHPVKMHHDRDSADRSVMRERKRRHKNQDRASDSGSSSSGHYRKNSYSSSGDSQIGGHKRRGRRQRRSQSWSSSEKGRIRSTVKKHSHSHSHSYAHSQRSSSSADSRGERKQGIKCGRRRTRNGSRRIKRSSRRSISLSSSGYSSEDHRRSHRKGHLGSHRSSNQIHKYRASPYMQRKEKSNFGEDHRNQQIVRDKAGGKKSTTCDYSKIIPGFDSMSPAEKVKAKIKLQLSETVVKDSSKGMSGEWERFDFNKEAPLDDDAKLDYFGDGTETRDDTGFLQNTGSTFMSSNYKARREAQVQEAHDAAIFGLPVDSTSVGKETNSRKEQKSSISVEEPVKDANVRVQLEQNSVSKNLLSNQVMAMQHVSWRERALKLKE